MSVTGFAGAAGLLIRLASVADHRHAAEERLVRSTAVSGAFAIDAQVERFAAVDVGPLDAVDDRPALDRHPAAIVLHPRDRRRRAATSMGKSTLDDVAGLSRTRSMRDVAERVGRRRRVVPLTATPSACSAGLSAYE